MTRKVFLVLLALVLALSVGLVACGGAGEQEEEEEEEEQEIRSWYDLDAIRNNLGGTYSLANNLDSTSSGYQELAGQTADAGKGWEPIGTADERFTGIFDGGGYSISGLYISRPHEDDIGLFGYIEEGIIKNVGLLDVDVTGGNQTGALVGYNWGGIVESNPARPYSTYSTGTVTGSDEVGGLVGYNWGGIVSLAQSSADIAHISGEAWRAGGLVGSNWGDVVLCIYSGSVTGDREVGGLVGLNGDLVPGGIGGQVISCYGEYTVTGNWFVGGAAGVNLGSLENIALNFSVNGHPLNGDSFLALNTDTTIDGHSADTAPQGSYVGGLVGLNKGSVNNCVAVGSVTGYQYVGGLVGYNDPDGAIGSSLAATGVEGSLDFGGLIGYNDAVGAVANSFWDSEACDTNTGVGTGDATGIIGRSSQEVKDINTYIQAGWDICAVAPGELNTSCTWNMVSGGYPFLSDIAAEQEGKEEETPTEVVLGATLPLTGFLAGFGQQEFGMQKAIDDWNDTYGGMYLSEWDVTVPVRLIIKDNESDFAQVGSLSEDLVLAERVHALLSPLGPENLHHPTSVVANEYGVPQVIGGGPFERWLEGAHEGEDWPFSWFSGLAVDTPSASPRDVEGYTLADTFFMYMDRVDAKANTNMIAGVFAFPDTDGIGWYNTVPGLMEDYGLTVVGVESELGLFATDATDFTPIIQAWQDAGVEIVWGNCPGPHFGWLLSQCYEQSFRPKLCLVHRAALVTEDVNAWGTEPPLGWGVGTEIWWSPSYAAADGFVGIGGRTAASLAEDWAAEIGEPLNQFIGPGYMVAQVMLDAIERAGDVDGHAINAALAATDLDTINGWVKFDPQTHFSAQPISFGQWFYDEENEDEPFELHIVASALDSIPQEADPIFPKPW